MTFMGVTLTARLVAIAIAVLAIVGMIFWGPAACQKINSLRDQAKVTGAQHNAFGNSAEDAIGTTAAAGAREASSEELTRQNERDIMAAEGARDPVNPGVARAARTALCRREAYRNDPQCKEK